MTSLRAGLAVVYLWLQSWVLVFGNRCNNTNDIELYDPNDRSKFHCWRTRCYEGQESTLEPGSVHPDSKDLDVSCRPCGKDLFSSHATNYRCTKCKTCGNMEVIENCTVSTDTVCSTSVCRSRMFYFNKTDGQCHQCSECCGTDNTNIQPQCLVSFSHIGSVTGQKGALHCKEDSFQRCNESLTINVSPNMNNVSVVNNCSKAVNDTMTPPSRNIVHTSTSDQKGRSWDSLDILLLCLCISVVLVCIFLFWLCKRERRMRLRNGCSCNCTPLICHAGSTGQGQRHVSEFQERLSAISEGLRIDSIDHVVQGFIEKLDTKKPGVKHWYHVGRQLGLSNDDLDEIRRYDRPGESPTRTLVSILSTWAEVITLRAFVQVLHTVGRNDICKNIINHYENGQQDAAV